MEIAAFRMIRKFKKAPDRVTGPSNDETDDLIEALKLVNHLLREIRQAHDPGSSYSLNADRLREENEQIRIQLGLLEKMLGGKGHTGDESQPLE